ncbi:lipase family protein [Actinomycetes bacterium M1A6_2h]
MRRAGDLLSAAPLPMRWCGSPGVSKIAYLTEGSDGTPTAAAGLMFLPSGEAPDEGWPVVSWGHGTSGIGRYCGLTASRGAPHDAPFLAELARAGYAAVATDYLGLTPTATQSHPYLDIRTEATATIDIVRAARQADSGLSERWVSFGVSQGGHAALGAGSIAAKYAPELDYRGTAAIAPASHVETLLPMAGPHAPRIPELTGLVAVAGAVLSGMSLRPSVFDVQPYLSDEGRRVLAGLSDVCVDKWGDIVDGVTMNSMLTRSLSEPAFVRALGDYMRVPTYGYNRPIFVAQGTRDTMVPLSLTMRLLAEFDGTGTEYELATFDSDHDSIAEEGGFSAGLDFIRQVLPVEGQTA